MQGHFTKKSPEFRCGFRIHRFVNAKSMLLACSTQLAARETLRHFAMLVTEPKHLGRGAAWKETLHFQWHEESGTMIFVIILNYIYPRTLPTTSMLRF